MIVDWSCSSFLGAGACTHSTPHGIYVHWQPQQRKPQLQLRLKPFKITHTRCAHSTPVQQNLFLGSEAFEQYGSCWFKAPGSGLEGLCCVLDPDGGALLCLARAECITTTPLSVLSPSLCLPYCSWLQLPNPWAHAGHTSFLHVRHLVAGV